MATNPFHQLDVIRNASQKGNIITDCYRLMYKKELWMKAYAKLYPNAANLTKGTSEVTIDGLSLQKMDETIEKLKNGTFRFAPVRRVCIPKANGKKRQVGVPNFKDKLVQEVMRMILANVYEPILSNHSHGFREGRSCHTALSQIKNTWKGLTWCIEGDIKGCFDHMDHSVLVNLISKRIDDHRFLLLIHNALTSGVIETSTYHNTDSGTPQAGRISPLLANIYLHEFDLFVEKQMENFDKITDPMDKIDQRMKYVRYADIFVIGIAGCKDSAINVKGWIKDFLEQKLHLELREEKALITHLENPIPFLGYEFRKWDERKGTRVSYKSHKQPMRKTTLSGAIKLEIPEKKIKDFAIANGYGNLDNFKSMHRANLMNHSELEILYTYNAELRGIANYYKLANNYHHLDKLFYLAESSFLKTIAKKRRSTSRKVASSMRTHKQGVLCLVRKDKHGNDKLHQLVKLKDMPKHHGAIKVDEYEISSRTDFKKRLLAKACGTIEGQKGPSH